jgi:type II secretory pathway pseudopilin PulG
MNQASKKYRGNGFTLVEVLVVFIVIALLIGILVVALSNAIESARRSATVAQLQAIGTAIDAFENDMGFVPPLVSPSLVSPVFSPTPTGLVTPQTYAIDGGNPSSINDYYAQVRYNSEYTLAAYLLGIGAFNPDELDDNGVSPGSTPLHDGVPGPGFKSPGPLKAWKVNPPNGSLRHDPQLTGRTYGPYLDFGTLEGVLEFDEDRGMYKIVDVWGNPIRYYSGWTGVRIVDGNRVPTLDEIPIQLRASDSLEAQSAGADLPELLSFDDELRTAKYALLSAGESSDDYYADNPVTGDTDVFLAPFGDFAIGDDGIAAPVESFADYSSLDPTQQRSFQKQVESNLRLIK